MRFIGAIIVFAVLATVTPSVAQSPLTDVVSSESETSREDDGSALDKSQRAAIEDLIVKLESETGRQELIEELEALLKATEPASENAEENGSSSERNAGGGPKPVEAMADRLDIDALVEDGLSAYKAWLVDLGVHYNTATRILVIVGLVILWICLLKGISFLVGRVERTASIQKWTRIAQGDPAARYARIARFFLYGVVTVGIVYLTAVTLGFSFSANGFGSWLQNLANAFANILLVLVVALFVYEASNYALTRASRRRSNRIQTVIPLLRNVFMVAITVVVGMVVLSELGIDIMPLLAGAGVLGIAIGFGAQTLVKDLLSGIIIIMEDLIQIGDWVALGGSEGTVENITFRKVDLRDLSGAVHTVPFGTIDTVRNMTKGYSFAVLETGVAYREDTDAVTAEIVDIAKNLREDKSFGGQIVDDIEVMGVDALGDSAVVIKTRMQTRAGQQWAVAREMNRRIKYRFDELGIEIPFPHQTVYFGEPKEGRAAPANILIDREEAGPPQDGSEEKSDSRAGPEDRKEARTSRKQLGDDSADD